MDIPALCVLHHPDNPSYLIKFVVKYFCCVDVSDVFKSCFFSYVVCLRFVLVGGCYYCSVVLVASLSQIISSVGCFSASICNLVEETRL